jgi:hypothetical protein
MNAEILEAMDARVRRLEKQNRWLKTGYMTFLLAFISLLTMGQSKVRGTVEAQRFVLTSASGEILAELATIGGEFPRLTLASPNGEKEVEVSPLGLSVSDHGVSNKLPLAHYGDVGLYFADNQGHIVLEVGGAATDSLQLTAIPEIKLFDKAGSRIWHAP